MKLAYAYDPGSTAVLTKSTIGFVKDPPMETLFVVPAMANSGVAFEDAVVNLPF